MFLNIDKMAQEWGYFVVQARATIKIDFVSGFLDMELLRVQN